MGTKIKVAFFIFFGVMAVVLFVLMCSALDAGNKIDACFYAIWTIFFADKMEEALE